MKISIIVAVYKDLVALKLIIQCLRLNKYPHLEILIAEDGNDNTIKDYIHSITDINVVHTTQPDKGIRKAKSLNNAILQSTGDYLIFIDGDCLPYTNFIEYHAKLAEKGKVLTGRRVNLDSRLSALIRSNRLQASALQQFFSLFYPYLAISNATHIEQGFSFNPDSWFYKSFISSRKKRTINLLGCNFSCHKDDIVLIDGFDEFYYETAVADDTDLQWRFEAAGIKLKSCKLAANVFHLYHPFRQGKPHEAEEVKKMKLRKATGCYQAEKGLSTHNKPASNV